MASSTHSTGSLGGKLVEVRKKWGWFVAAGIAMIIFGMIALGNLFAATIAVIYVTGAMLIVAGVVEIIQAFGAKSWGKVAYWLLSGLLYAVAGILMFTNPLFAAGVFTLLLAVALFAVGVLRIIAGFDAKPAEGWGWMVAAGVFTVLFGVLIGVGWPINSIWLIGMILGIDLIFQGVAWISFGFALKPKS
jgi:uncharacterized membrane protein HdeD (DUF308 family)